MRWPHLRVVFMSGYTDEELRRHGVLGATDYFVEKPFTPESLARRVREVLDNGHVNLLRSQP